MTSINAYAAYKAKEQLKPFKIERREAGPHDVEIDILYCGVCHSDLHQVRNEWGGAEFPMVPGHEIVGKVVKVGQAVTRYKIGDAVGVGCFVDSCRQCSPCQQKLEQFCDKGMVETYNGHEKNTNKITYGGYSSKIIVDENYVMSIPSNIPLDKAAPLLCAGITTFSPLHHWDVKKGDKVAVIGLGGLGHMAVKIAHALGADVTVLSTSDSKKEDAKRLGANAFANTKHEETFKQYKNYFDFILNTVSANINIDQYLDLLQLDGTMVVVGAPEKPYELKASPLIAKRRSIAGSLIGGTQETQAMLDFCGKHNIASDIELISIDQINEAYERMLKGDVKYRFVIDMKSLAD